MKNQKENIILSSINSSRPDLQVGFRLPGAYIVKDGVLVPDLNDEAMRERETINDKRKTEEKLNKAETKDEVVSGQQSAVSEDKKDFES